MKKELLQVILEYKNILYLKYVTENNIGIEITSSGKTSARSVFKGEVAKVFAIQGANMTVIIRHGKYLISLYKYCKCESKTGR